VRVEGKTVRGYKAEQFAEAFRRVLGVTSVTSVTSGSSIEAESNACNACNTYHATDVRETEPLSDIERARRFDALYPPA
jgi:hypothetical protein